MAIAALILSVISLCISLGLLVFVLAKQFSTHQVQMVPIDMPFSGNTKNPKLTGLEDFELDDDGDKRG